MTSGSLNSGHATSLTGSATDAAKKMKGGSLSDAIDAFDSAVALAKTTGNTTQLRRIASDALNFVRKSDKTTDYMKKNVVPRMREEFSEIFGSDMNESGQTLREVSAYRLGKRFGKAAIAAAKGSRQKASGAAKTDIVQRDGKSVSVRRDIGGAGGGQFVNAITAMRQSMQTASSLGRRAERLRRIVGTRETPLFSDLPDDPAARSDEIRRRQIERLRRTGSARGKSKLSGKQERERAARRKAEEERKRSEEETRRDDLQRRGQEESERQRLEDEQAKIRAEEDRARQERDAAKTIDSEKRKTSSTAKKPASFSSGPQQVSGQRGNTEISEAPDLYVPSDIAIFSGTAWSKAPTPAFRQSVESGLGRLDSLLSIPPPVSWANPKLGLGVTALPILLRKARGYGGVYRFGSDGKSNITISHFSRNHEMTFLHEFGHFIDGELFKSPEGVSELNPDRHSTLYGGMIPELDKVISLAVESEGIIKLNENATAMPGNPGFNYSNWAEYYGDPREIWARAFAQWALLRTDGDVAGWADTTRRRLEPESFGFDLRKIFNAGSLGNSYNTQWEDPQDFAPIATAIDELFDAAGWLK
jgi:hypothetical protein